METYPADFEARLLYVTRNLVQYQKYGNDMTRAANVVRKYFKEKSPEECITAIAKFMKAYQEGTRFVETNLTDYEKPKMPEELILKEKEFLAAHSALSPEILRSMLDWIYLGISGKKVASMYTKGGYSR